MSPTVLISTMRTSAVHRLPNRGNATCTTALNTCNGNLGLCNANFATCDANLVTCNANLGTCNADLATADANLGTCDANLGTCNADLSLCLTHLAICEAGGSFPLFPATGQHWDSDPLRRNGAGRSYPGGRAAELHRQW
jgi:hypothetical protein